MNKQNRILLSIAFIGVASLLYPIGTAETGTCLVVTRDDESFLKFPVSLPRSFEISWIHSVEKEEWREQFVIDIDGSIRIESTRFRTFGAGVPDNAPETSIEDGWVIMRGINRPVDPLVIRSITETEHKLFIADKTYSLPGGRYRFTVSDTCSGIQRSPTTKEEMKF